MVTVNIVIETQKGKKIKYELKNNKLVIDHKLFAPMPVNYGFVPNTKSSDGDELDALYFSKSVKPKVKFRAKVIGVMGFIDNKKRDDKIICVPVASKKTLKNLRAKLEYIKYFFERYKKHTKVLGFEGIGKALKVINGAKK